MTVNSRSIQCQNILGFSHPGMKAAFLRKDIKGKKGILRPSEFFRLYQREREWRVMGPAGRIYHMEVAITFIGIRAESTTSSDTQVGTSVVALNLVRTANRAE